MHQPTESRNVVFTQPSEVAWRPETVPPPGPGEILCAARSSLISTGTESFCLAGVFDPGTYWQDYVRYPFHPGYSMVAQVLAVGAGVTRWRVGDRVTGLVEHREYFVVPQQAVFAVPAEITDEEAAFATLARTTQVGVRRAQLELGESVGVIGLGILGQLVVRYLRLGGARRIIAIDPSEARLQLAEAGGATHALALSAGEARDEVDGLTGGRMLDVVFDITGHSDVLAAATTLLRPLGRVVLLGDSPMPSRQHLGPRVVGDSISILGIHGLMYPEHATVFHPWTAEEMTAVFFEFVRQGRMSVRELVTQRESPADAASVYAGLLSDRSRALGVVFDWARVK